MSTYNFPPFDMEPRLVEPFVRELCEAHDLDAEKVLRDLPSGGTIVRVALIGDDGGWPETHIRFAREQYRKEPST